jgi:hypothetical protein
VTLGFAFDVTTRDVALALFGIGAAAAVWMLATAIQVRRLRRADEQLRSSLVDLAVVMAEARMTKGDRRPVEAVFGEAFGRLLTEIDEGALYEPAAGGTLGGWAIVLSLVSSGAVLLVPPPWDLVVGGSALLALVALLPLVGTPGGRERFAENDKVDAFLLHASPQVRAQMRWALERLRGVRPATGLPN